MKRKNTGCLIALIVAGVLGVVIVVHLFIAFYFISSRIHLKEARVREAPEQVVQQTDTSTSASSQP